MALEGRNIFHVWAWVYFSSNGGMHAHKCTHMYKAMCKHIVSHYCSVSLSLAQKNHANVHLYRPNIPQQSLYILHVLLHYNYEVQQWAVPEGVGVEFADLQGLQAIHRGCQSSASGGPGDLLTNHDHMPSLPANNMHTCLPEKQPYNAHNTGNIQHLFKLEKTLLTGRVLDFSLSLFWSATIHCKWSIVLSQAEVYIYN